MPTMSWRKKYGYVWVTLGFFIFSLVGHWLFAWFAFVNEQRAHLQPVAVGDYLVEVLRDTLENWQSEFLQLIWQVAGLSMLLYVGSPQSKDGDERVEEKLDLILKKLDPERAEKDIERLDRKFPKQ